MIKLSNIVNKNSVIKTFINNKGQYIEKITKYDPVTKTNVTVHHIIF